MFGFNSKRDEQPKAVVERPRAVVLAKPSAEVLSATDQLVLASYDSIADGIGFAPAQLVAERIKAFLAASEWAVFPSEQVKPYLTAMARSAGLQGWCWRPLRAKDVVKEYQWGLRGDNDSPQGYYRSSRWDCRPYGRLVPSHVLMRVGMIEAEFGDSVKFFVSDLARPDLDPFIMVRPTACDDGGYQADFIFDMWDEPGFGKKEPK
jgi:hypothetical protein